MYKILAIINLICLALSSPLLAQNDTLPDAIINPGPVPGHILVVDKAEQLLYLYSHDGKGVVSLKGVMACSTGRQAGDKFEEGDRKTPNGFYTFTDKKLPQDLSPIYGILAYPTDYPNFWDRHLGRGGYGIWLNGSDKKLTDFNTDGRVELQNADLVSLESLIRLHDTPLIIYERLTMVPVDQLRREGEDVLAFLESWGRSWVIKDHETYQKHYAPDFVNSDGQSFSEWMEHKKNVAQSVGSIKLGAKDLRVFRHRDLVVAVFQQDYQVDEGFASSGLKRLYLKKEGPIYQIVGEEYQPLPDESAVKWLSPEQKNQVLTGTIVVGSEDGEEAQREANESEGQSAGTGPDSGPTQVAQISAAIDAAALDPRTFLDESESRTLLRAEEEALDREESSLNQEITRVRVKAAEAETTQVARKKKERKQAAVLDDPIAAAEARALAAAQAKLSGRPLNREETRAHLISLAQSWGEAWNRRDVQAYFSFYHPDFYFEEKGLKLDDFIAYRRPLIEQARQLEVRLSHFSVKFQGPLVRVMFRQSYRSDQVHDLGRKILMFKETESGWKIISETWQSF